LAMYQNQARCDCPYVISYLGYHLFRYLAGVTKLTAVLRAETYDPNCKLLQQAMVLRDRIGALGSVEHASPQSTQEQTSRASKTVNKMTGYIRKSYISKDETVQEMEKQQQHSHVMELSQLLGSSVTALLEMDHHNAAASRQPDAEASYLKVQQALGQAAEEIRMLKLARSQEPVEEREQELRDQLEIERSRVAAARKVRASTSLFVQYMMHSFVFSC